MKRLECQAVQETLAIDDPDRFHKWKEHENVQASLNGISCQHLDATIEVIQADPILKNSFAKVQQHILFAIGHHHEKNVCTGRARSISCAESKPTTGKGKKGAKDEPWMKKG